MDRLRLCFLNTYLLRVPLPFVPGRHVHAVPAVRARAGEIGRWLSGRHEVVALSEVFEPDDLDALAEAWGDGGPVTAVPGPGPRRPQAGSGLAVLASGASVVDREALVYRERGRRLFDSDAYADKGALAVRLDLPEGPRVDVTVTHLLAGDDVPAPHRHVDGVLARRRRTQVAELLELVAERPAADVHVVAGDFNIEADSPTGHWLAERFGELGFVDAWAEAGEGDGRTVPTGRIDYVFVLGAAVESCVPLVVDRDPDVPERDALPTLSDHAALDVVLRLG